jgi:hypothetical protein
MRKYLLAIASPLLALLTTGCAETGSAAWPSGTEAVLYNPQRPQVIALVPFDQRVKMGGQGLVLIATGTRVVTLGDPYDTPLETRQEVTIVSGKYDGAMVVVSPACLMPASPADATVGTDSAWWFFLLCVATMTFGALFTGAQTGVEWIRERSRIRRLSGSSYRAHTIAARAESFRKRQRPVNLQGEDFDRWVAWIADRNARVRTRASHRA